MYGEAMNRNVYIEARNLIANRRFADAYRGGEGVG